MYLVVKYLMDDTIHTADDMEKYFDIVPLAVIPDVEELASEKQQKKGKLEKGFWMICLGLEEKVQNEF